MSEVGKMEVADPVEANRLGAPVNEGEPQYYARLGKVWSAPIRRVKANGSTSISLGFPVCTMHEAAGEENAATVAMLMNRGDVLPDLLSALPRIMTCLELVLSGKPCRDVPEALGEARAAIARAEGR